MEKDEKEEKESLRNLMDEAEILAELKEEERMRKKNAKIVSMAVVGLIICGALFFWIRHTPPKNRRLGMNLPPPDSKSCFLRRERSNLPASLSEK